MTKPLWQTLLKSALETEEDEIDCQECYDLLDEYTDLLIAGAAPCKVMYLVKQHLKHCPDFVRFRRRTTLTKIAPHMVQAISSGRTQAYKARIV